MGFWDTLIESTYDFRMQVSRVTGLGIRVHGQLNPPGAPVDFYSLKARTQTHEEFRFSDCKGKKVLIVNLASKCGFTPQYRELEELHQQHPSLLVLGFPSNNFGGQEPGSDEEIARFCHIRYQVTFPIFEKGDVRGKNCQEVYQWLTDPKKNGWNREAPRWNFYKYLVDETGKLAKVYSSSVSPKDISLD